VFPRAFGPWIRRRPAPLEAQKSSLLPDLLRRRLTAQQAADLLELFSTL
jgi:hypothetical protein